MLSLSRKFALTLFSLLSLLPAISLAAMTAWKIVPAQSSLTFTATQNGAPVVGKFTDFSGDVNFDPAQLTQSNIKIIVNMGSISDPYNQLTDTLKAPDWFDVKVFPQATFQSSSIIKTGDKTFQAHGNLTIRNRTSPITLTFTQEEYSDTKAIMKGSTTIQRTAFGVGQREWADTKAIKDDVEIDFTVVAAVAQPAKK